MSSATSFMDTVKQNPVYLIGGAAVGYFFLPSVIGQEAVVSAAIGAGAALAYQYSQTS